MKLIIVGTVVIFFIVGAIALTILLIFLFDRLGEAVMPLSRFCLDCHLMRKPPVGICPRCKKPKCIHGGDDVCYECFDPNCLSA